jgi:hypothetical protein
MIHPISNYNLIICIFNRIKSFGFVRGVKYHKTQLYDMVKIAKRKIKSGELVTEDDFREPEESTWRYNCLGIPVDLTTIIGEQIASSETSWLISHKCVYSPMTHDKGYLYW